MTKGSDSSKARAGFWSRRVVTPILNQLRQGITPQAIALTIALGAIIGIFPIIGLSTTACGIVGVALRLNQPIIQLVNYLVYPLQILLIIPFCRAGEYLFRAEPVPLLNISDLLARFGQDPWQFLQDYGLVGVYGITAWLLLAPLIAMLIYFTVLPVLRRLALRMPSRSV